MWSAVIFFEEKQKHQHQSKSVFRTWQYLITSDHFHLLFHSFKLILNHHKSQTAIFESHWMLNLFFINFDYWRTNRLSLGHWTWGRMSSSKVREYKSLQLHLFCLCQLVAFIIQRQENECTSHNISTSSFVNIRQTLLSLFTVNLLMLVSGKTWVLGQVLLTLSYFLQS